MLIKCSKCNLIKKLIHFHKNKNSKTGFNNWCKECKNNYQKEQRMLINPPKPQEQIKTCNICNIEKDIQDFYKRKNGYLSYACKDCTKKEVSSRTQNISDNIEKQYSEIKICYCCKKEKLIYEFSKNKSRKDGLYALSV